MSKYEWTSYSNVHNLLLMNGGIIFGGAIRDTILHKFHATEFYKQRDEYLKINPNGVFDYDDKEISLNTLGRFTIPTDIDVFVYEDHYNFIISKLQKRYAIKITTIKDLQYTIKDLEPHIYKLYKIEVFIIYQNVKPQVVKIDMIVCPNDRDRPFPLVDVDFNVNALFQSLEKGIYVSPMFCKHNHDRTMLLYNIMNDIKHKIARGVVINVSGYRIAKLIAKNWDVNIKFNIYRFHECSTIDDEDSCTICTINKKEFSYCVNFMNCNCKSIICMTCIQENSDKIDKCPTCRSDIDSDNSLGRMHELRIYNEYCK
jgi:hypothetical protein